MTIFRQQRPHLPGLTQLLFFILADAMTIVRFANLISLIAK